MPETSSRRPPALTEPRSTPLEENRRALHRAVDQILDAWPKASDDAQAVGFPRGRGYGGTSGGQSGLRVPAEDGGGFDTVPATGVELAALNPSVAVAWVAELHDTVTRLLAAVWPARSWSLVWTPAGLAPVLHEAVETLFGSWTLDDLIDADPRSVNHRRDVFGLYRLADDAARYWPPPPRKGDRAGTVTVGERGNSVETCRLCGDPVAGGRADPIGRIDNEPYHASCAKAVQASRGTHPGTQHDHGTVNRYNAGCHCDECREALASYHRARRRAKTQPIPFAESA